ncbi:MAG: HD domain-containing protein [Firmicutes bacterium]|nr:HD domain-containing protein [Bacillota bacterium]
MGESSDLKKQMEFLAEIDKLKNIFRQSLLTTDQRRENDAEHSWHLCMYATVLSDYAPEGCNMLRCIQMMLVHDIVEIYAGDTYLYDEEGYKTKKKRESEAADKIYSMLPESQEVFLKGLWTEFEENTTPTANFANTLDRLQPIMLNYYSRGEKWLVNKVTKEQVFSKWKTVARSVSNEIESFLENLLDECVEKGYLLP